MQGGRVWRRERIAPQAGSLPPFKRRYPAIAEVYPALLSRDFDRDGRTSDQHDAYSIAASLCRSDQDGSLAGFLKPGLTRPERVVAQVEGWILGVV